ncbi:MAG TPA: helix-turn-helix domain-containing protein, partial [Aggregicoccus sp.]|nr:helix-turn-helix domain-containing protein [Aggregicoccus sp.]
MRKGELTHQAILQRAVRLASRVGLEGLSIGGLAEDLGLSKSGLFAHFESKAALQVETLQEATRIFTELVVRPALAKPRGEPRLRAAFENWLHWGQAAALEGGCLFMAASVELDDQEGPARDCLVQNQRDWLDTLATIVRSCVREGHFREDTDPEQVAHDLYGIALAHQHAARLMRDPKAEARARRAFEALLAAHRRAA